MVGVFNTSVVVELVQLQRDGLFAVKFAQLQTNDYLFIGVSETTVVQLN